MASASTCRAQMEQQPPLPAALEQLLAHLAASSSSNPASVTGIELPLANDRYGNFFKPSGVTGVNMGDERRWQVRLQLLTAIAKCPTIRSVHVLGKYEIGVHRVEEVEALLGGLAASNTVLEKLSLYQQCGALVSEASCRGSLGRLLSHNRTLQVLNLRNAGIDAAGLGHLVRALLANPDPALRELGLYGNKVGDAAGAAHVAALLQHDALPALRCLDITSIGLDVEGAHLIARALARSSTVEELAFGGESSHAEAMDVVLQVGLGQTEDADTVVRRTGNRSIKTLRLYPHSSGTNGTRCASSMNAMLRTNDVLQSLEVWGLELDSGSQALLEIGNSGMRELSLRDLRSSKTFKQHVIMSLRSNTKLEVLTMAGWNDLDDQLFKDLMDTLEINTTLREINMWSTSWAREGKDAFVRQALRRNAGQVAYLPSLKNAGLRFVAPNMARLFLCGPAAAGKTTLRHSMVACRKKSWRRLLLPRKRTKAIEVELLLDEPNMQVAIWDLAGQEEFRILHDHLFPDSRQACMFLFVFNPFDVDTGKLKPNMEEEFENDFAYWLRFIASNAKSGGDDVLLQVLVVITHLDKMVGETEQSIQDWVRPKMKVLKKKFHGLVSVRKSIHVVNAGSSKLMDPVVSEAFKCLTYLCSEKLLAVPETCAKMSVVLTKWVSKHPSRPFMAEDTFHNLCKAELKELKGFNASQQSEIVDAISSYLHDVGSIMYFKDLKLRVVNPNWITHVFLGSLIQSEKPILTSTSEGFMSRRQLEQVLTSRFMRAQKHSGYSIQDLLNIMLRLEFCYEAPFGHQLTKGFFIPTSIYNTDAKALKGVRPLEWPSEDRQDIKFDYFGRRLQCRDQIQTLLTLAFFPRFQVNLRNKLFSDGSLGILPYQYKFGCNLISIVYNGMDILIENSDGEHLGDYIDILVRSDKSRNFTNAFLRKHVLDRLKDFCASPSGCPGVALVESIINPYCVEHLTVCASRREQAVLKTKLQDRLLYEKVHELQGSCEGYFVGSSTLDFVYAWPPIAEIGGIRNYQVEQLLDAEDLVQIVERNHEYFERQKTNVEEAANSLMVEGSNHPRGIRASKAMLTNSRSDHFSSTRDQLNDIRRAVDDNHKQVMKTIMSIGKNIVETLRSVEKNIISSQQDTLRGLESTMDTILSISLDFQRSQMPKRPFLSTEGVSFTQRFMAGILIGKTVRLHLMCEDQAGNHIVAGQLGYEMIVEYSNCKWMREISIKGAKLLFFLAKAGLHVAAGLGNALPDFGQWAADASVMAGVAEQIINQLPHTTTIDDKDANLDNAWKQLQQLLEPLLRDRMVELFQLYKVSIGGKVVWLCKKCMTKCNY